MKLTNEKTKFIVGISLSLLLGIGGGFALKESVDKANTAQASEPATVPVQKVQDNEIGKFNRLIAPPLWDVYLDPLWMPVDFAVRALPLVPLMTFPSDVPKIQTMDQPNELRVVAQVPGLSEKDVNVQVSDSAITIKGHKVKEEKDKSLFQSVDESFQQTVTLPCKVDADKVQATVKDGILTVSLPKARAEKAVAKAN
jgi:HSP20 family protein